MARISDRDSYWTAEETNCGGWMVTRYVGTRGGGSRLEGVRDDGGVRIFPDLASAEAAAAALNATK